MTGYAAVGAILGLAGAGWLGYSMGRYSVARDAWRTISTLRSSVARYRLQNERLAQQNEALRRRLDATRGMVIEVPGWLNGDFYRADRPTTRLFPGHALTDWGQKRRAKPATGGGRGG